MTDQARTALVTGASRGIGAAIARALGADGHNVIINYLAEDGRDNAADAAQVADDIRQTGSEALCVSADVTDRGAVADMIQSVGDVFGSVDILVNNAGITRDRTMRKLPPEDWDRVIEVNLTGAFNCARAVLNDMIEHGWGRIISISSVVALAGNFGQANYAASKAGLLGMTRSLAREVARKGITVNAVAPGFIDTEMTQAIPEDVADTIIESIPMGRMGRPGDVADAVSFLASDRAAYISGHTLSVNGGFHT